MIACGWRVCASACVRVRTLHCCCFLVLLGSVIIIIGTAYALCFILYSLNCITLTM